MAATESSASPCESFTARASLIGNSMHVVGLAWLIAHQAMDWGFLTRVPNIKEFWTGRAWKAVASERQPAEFGVSEGWKKLSPVQRMTLFIVSRCDPKGPTSGSALESS